MPNAPRITYVAECYWAGVQEEDLRELDRRIEASVVAVAGDGKPARYLGWLLVIDDEVVLVLFEGPVGTVRRVAEHAEIPFGRLLQVAHAPRTPNSAADEEVKE
jgi:hypothetical protein